MDANGRLAAERAEVKGKGSLESPLTKLKPSKDRKAERERAKSKADLEERLKYSVGLDNVGGRTLDMRQAGRLHDKPEDCLYWPDRRAMYTFNPENGLYTEDVDSLRTKQVIRDRAYEQTYWKKKAGKDVEYLYKVLPAHLTAGVEHIQLDRLVDDPNWDSNHHLCGIDHPTLGVLDLTEGEMRRGERAEYILGRLGCVPDPKCEYGEWLDFLGFAFPGEGELEYVLAILASFLGGVRIKGVFYFQGVSNTGKSTMIDRFPKLYGSYFGTFPQGTLSRRDKGFMPNQHPTWMVDLRYCRVAVAPETENDQILLAAPINDWSDGGRIKAHRMRANNEQWTSFLKVLFYGNKLPKIEANSGTQTRFRVIPMSNKPSKLDMRLGERLERQAPGFLNYLAKIYATRLSDSDGFMPKPPKRFKQHTTDVLISGDPKAAFWRDAIEVTGDPKDRVTIEQIGWAQDNWTEDTGHELPPQPGRWIRDWIKDLPSPRPEDVPKVDTGYGSRKRGFNRIRIRSEFKATDPNLPENWS